ncbi:MAG TPA: ABC transporter ATP-binding protein [Gammaproteobacteria bacterium]|jgi:NitT/TauT family transport system ATP-binding protein
MSIAGTHIHLSYPTRNGSVVALEDISFEIRAQEFVCIVGPSGCGKTTLLKIVAGLLKPTSGRIVFNSTAANGRPRNALVFQEHGLFPWMSVLDNVGLGLEMRGVRRKSRHAQAMQFIEQFGLSAFAYSYPHELSVGMRQRVSLARAFIMDPEVLLMDEPFASLDALTKVILQQELLRIWREHRKQVVYVTHDIEEALLLGDRVLVMSGRPGSILEEISVPLTRPRDLLDRGRPEIVERKNHIWRILEEEVRNGIGGIA